MALLTNDSFGREVHYTLDGAHMYVTVLQDDVEVLSLTMPATAGRAQVLSAVNAMKTGVDPLDVRRAALRQRVNDIRDERIQSPVMFNGVLFDADHGSRARLTGITAMLGSLPGLPDGFTWRSFENIDVPMTKASMLELASTFMARDYACFVASWQLKALIDASDAPETIDLSAFWP